MKTDPIHDVHALLAATADPTTEAVDGPAHDAGKDVGSRYTVIPYKVEPLLPVISGVELLGPYK